MITIDQFAMVSLVVGRILSVEVLEGSNKLFRLSITIGEDEPRTILSGIREYYTPESLVDRMCIVVANLEPRKMLGVESEGMLVCVSYTDGEDSSHVEIVEPPISAPVGSRLS